jgi:serine/threonine protein kinase
MNPGTELSHYRILEPLGKGGMGEVYVADDTRLHRKVAIKVLSGLMNTDAERRQRLEREARAIAALNHPNIVTIHAIDVTFCDWPRLESRAKEPMLRSIIR